MLVLTRRIGEQIVLPGVSVRFVLLSVAGGRVRVGVEAPRAVEVVRGELETRAPAPADYNRSFQQEGRDEPS
jgi:carbon storage regulator